jgi:hypothetical protein
MTISSQTRTAGPFTGNGVTTTFPFTFKVFAASDLYVVRTDATTGIDTVLVLGTDYTVTLNTNQNSSPGGSITLPTALASGFKLTATSALQYLQPTDLTNQGGFYPKVINNALDYLTILVQQLLTKVGNSLQLPISVTGVSTTLPSPVGAQVIGWNSAGTALQNYSSNSFASSVAYGQTQALVTNGTGSQTAFTLATSGVTANNIKAFIGGVAQRPGIDFTLSANGLVVTFTTAPPAGTNNVFITWQQGLSLGTVPDGAVNTATVLDGAITAAKLASGAAASNVGAGGVSTAMLATGAVTTAKLATGAATGAALGADVVQTTGAQTLAGVKTFSSPIALPDATQQGTAFLGRKAQTFTSNGTFTIPAGITALKVTLVGGGGGSGGALGIVCTGGATSGGGGGGTCISYLTGLTPGGTISVTIGGAGTAGAATGTAGGAGGNSTITSGTQSITTVTAGGGGGSAGTTGGTSFLAGGASGSATNGTINIPGQKGQTSPMNSVGGPGGSSQMGFGGTPDGLTAAGTAGVGYGAGASGAGEGGTSRAGAAGTAGIVIFEW